MKHRFLLSSFLIVLAVVGGNLADRAAIGAPLLPEIVAANPEDLSEAAIALTVEDVPPGFSELPPSISAEVIAQFATLRQQFGQDTLPADQVFAFFNPASIQAIVGFTGELATPQAIENFDANLAKLENADAQAQLLAQLRERLKAVGSVEIESYAPLPNIEEFGEAATGFTLALTLQGVPFRVDLISFRRDRVGAFTAVMYRQQDEPLPLVELATKLDRRILEALKPTP
jgi:hypothetical protein